MGRMQTDGYEWKADIDAVSAAVKLARMKRIKPLALIAAVATLILTGLIWKVGTADECMDQKRILIAPMSRQQHCADP